MKCQGTTANSYLYSFCNPFKPVFDRIKYAYKYEIPIGEGKLGYVYKILFFNENDELVAVGERHPIHGDKIIMTEKEKYLTNGDKIWNFYKNTVLRAHKDDLIDKYKIT